MSTLKIVNFVLAAFIALFISSCGISTKVHVTTDATANFGKYHSFAWLEDKKSTSTTPSAYNNDIVRNNIRFFATQELTKEGYVQNLQAPDILLELQVNAQPVRRVTSYNNYPYSPYSYIGRRAIFVSSPYAYYPYSPVTTQHYEQSDVTINVIDKASNQLVGTISGFTDVDNPSDFNKHLQEAIVKIIRKSPLSRAS